MGGRAGGQTEQGVKIDAKVRHFDTGTAQALASVGQIGFGLQHVNVRCKPHVGKSPGGFEPFLKPLQGIFQRTDFTTGLEQIEKKGLNIENQAGFHRLFFGLHHLFVELRFLVPVEQFHSSEKRLIGT